MQLARYQMVSRTEKKTIVIRIFPHWRSSYLIFICKSYTCTSRRIVNLSIYCSYLLLVGVFDSWLARVFTECWRASESGSFGFVLAPCCLSEIYRVLSSPSPSSSPLTFIPHPFIASRVLIFDWDHYLYSTPHLIFILFSSTCPHLSCWTSILSSLCLCFLL